MTCILSGFKRADGAGAAYGNTQNVGAFVFSSPTGANGANVPFTLPDYVNATIPLATYLATQSAAGWSNGMMLQWTGTGSSCMSSRNTAIKPYTFTALTYTHIPNVGLDLSSQITGAALTALVSAGTYSDEGFTTSPSGLKLGFWGYQPIAAGVAALGVTDGSLTELITTQQLEWTNFTTIQSATSAALVGATPVTTTTTGGTPYNSSSLAQSQIDIQIAADIAAHAGATAVGNVVTWDEAAGTMLSGAGTITGPTFIGGTDPHSLHATMSMTKDFLGGYDVKRHKVKTYSIRAVSGVAVRAATLVRLDNDPLWPPMWPILSPPDYYGATDADAANAATAAAPGGNNQTETVSPPTFNIVSSNKHQMFIAGIYSVAYDQLLYQNGILIGTYPDQSIYRIDLAAATITQYYIDTSTVSNLTLSPNAGLTGTSAMSASQEVLTWQLPL